MLTTCSDLTLKFFEKKRGLELVSLPHFLYEFEEKYFAPYNLSTDQMLLPPCLYFMRYLAVFKYV